MTGGTTLEATASASARERLVGLDACRIFAALGVVWMHLSTPLNPRLISGRFGVPYFIVVASMLAMRGTTGRTFGEFGPMIVARARRILVPFVVWSVLVAVVRLAKWRFLHGAPVRITWLELALEGTAGAYWFLPFIFVVGVIALALGLAMERRPSARRPLAAACALAAVVTTVLYDAPFVPTLDALWRRHALDTPEFSVLTRYWFELPMVLAAFAIALARDAPAVRTDPPKARKSWLVVAVLALVFGVLLNATRGPLRDPPGDHALGLVLLGVAFTVPETRFVKALARLGRHGYFVYLAHVIAIWPFIVIAQRGYVRPGVLYLAAATVAVVALGIGASVVARRVPFLRWLVP